MSMNPQQQAKQHGDEETRTFHTVRRSVLLSASWFPHCEG